MVQCLCGSVAGWATAAKDGNSLWDHGVRGRHDLVWRLTALGLGVTSPTVGCLVWYKGDGDRMDFEAGLVTEDFATILQVVYQGITHGDGGLGSWSPHTEISAVFREAAKAWMLIFFIVWRFSRRSSVLAHFPLLDCWSHGVFFFKGPLSRLCSALMELPNFRPKPSDLNFYLGRPSLRVFPEIHPALFQFRVLHHLKPIPNSLNTPLPKFEFPRRDADECRRWN